ncbi:hypothetical protein ACHAWF_018136 [Thalassiosira exigua]
MTTRRRQQRRIGGPATPSSAWSPFGGGGGAGGGGGPSNRALLLAGGLLYALLVLSQNFHLRGSDASYYDVDSILAATKDAFLGLGDSSGGGFPLLSKRPAAGAIVPVELTVNFLKPIAKAPGAPPDPPEAPSASGARAPEDFLPVVVPSAATFRWAHRAREGAKYDDAERVAAYRIVVRQVDARKKKGGGKVAWDSGKVVVANGGVPDAVKWGGDEPRASPVVGQILEWKVHVWDAKDKENYSGWSRFAVGPEAEEDWEGGWIAHPSDVDTFDNDKNAGVSDECKLWHKRRPLPLFRARIAGDEYSLASDQVASALLVVSGLGSFRASFDGVPLSTSGPIDPPFTDYSKRVSYRGFDVTPFLAASRGTTKSHVVGVTLGSGWWDHRPVSGMAKPKLLPRGPPTVIAQLIITYASGKTRVVGRTGEGGSWQVSRGHIRESDLFTGEMVDLSVLGDMEGWDTPAGWSDDAETTGAANPYSDVNRWLRPAAYRTEVTGEERRVNLALQAKAMDRKDNKGFPRRNLFAAPIGKLVPNEIPPVMAMERIEPDEIHDLGGGRWMLDYGKAFSGVLHFDEGVPAPVVPAEGKYPRAHGFKAASESSDSFITVIYGESLEMTTGDINRVLVAGLGLHDGGPRHVSKKEGATKNSYCFPDDHDGILSQKDVYVVPKASEGKRAELFSLARQSHFTTHSFRFAEVCCSAEPPRNAHALLYRTAVEEWGTFDSSNVLINGGYELVKNAMASNMLSVQSDCPHREKLPYGGDLVADSPAAMHYYDMSSFYKKTIRDWLDAQWDNGAYTETSVWQDLNDYAGIGHGAGETVWATAPPVLTVRHMQHYGDVDLIDESLGGHVRWIDFLDTYFEAGMLQKGYDAELDQYHGQKSGLGDWLALRSRDTFLTHTAFYMAAGRCVAYLARKVNNEKLEERGMAVARKIQDRIVHLYLKNGRDDFDFPLGSTSHTPGPEMSLFSRIVPGEKRCIVLKNWFNRSGHTWPGDEENRFLRAISDEDKEALVRSGELSMRGKDMAMGWSQWQGLNEGIFAIRYALKTLSDMGFHNVALRKATGFGFGSTEYMLRHNATTMWESWWRSEDLYSRNHPMLGALAEWMASSVAGVSHFPTTTGARKMLFWPRFPKSATTLEYASATQGTVKGDFSIAWRFEDLPDDKSRYNSATVSVRVRMVVPPGVEGVFRAPMLSSNSGVSLTRAISVPDIQAAHSAAKMECKKRRKARLGFPYSWEFDRVKEQWHKYESSKSIGTPCESYLFHSSLDRLKWGKEQDVTTLSQKTHKQLAPGLHEDILLPTGLYEVVISNYQLEKEVEGTGRLGNIPEYFDPGYDAGPYCKEKSTFEWDIDDATHII